MSTAITLAPRTARGRVRGGAAAVLAAVVANAALATLGAVVVLAGPDLGPAWYPVALAALAYPSVMLGARWYERRRRA